MDLQNILDGLAHFKGLPRNAIEAARLRKAEVTAALIGEIDRVLGGEAEPEASPLFIGINLLAEWRATEAYRPLIRLLRGPDDMLEALLGDSLTESSHRIIASVCDGDPQPIYDLILDPAADEYVRSRQCDALAMLVRDGRVSRDEAGAFFRRCYAEFDREESNFVWEGWAGAISALGLSDLMDAVREACDRKWVDPFWAGFNHYEKLCREALTTPDTAELSKETFTLFGDTVEELAGWYCFSEAFFEEERQREQRAAEQERLERQRQEMAQLRARSGGKVGRNDPCPCGSGKKYKKCCL